MRHSLLQLLATLACVVLLQVTVTGQSIRGFELIQRPTFFGGGTTRVVAEDSSLLWVNLGDAQNIICRYQNGNWDAFSVSQLGMSPGIIRDMIRYDNKLWIAASSGLTVLTTTGGNPAFNASFNTGNGLPDNDIRAIDGVEDRLAIATFQGLAVYEDSLWTIYNSANSGFPSNRFSKIRIDANNIVAISDSGVSIRTRNQSWVHYDLNFLGVNSTNLVYAAPFGYGGIMVSTLNTVFYIIGNDKVELTQDVYMKDVVAARDLSVYNGTIWSLSPTTVQKLSNRREVYPITIPLVNSRLNFDGKGFIYFVGVQGVFRIDSLNFYSDRNNTVNSTVLDIGNYEMFFSAKGEHFYDVTNGNSQAEYPKRTSQTVPKKDVSNGGAIWIGGLDNTGTLHMSGQTYRQTTILGQNFWPGLLNSNGTVDTISQRKFDRIWKVNRFEIETFKQKFQAGLQHDPDYEIPSDLLEWPGTRPGTHTMLAPYVDVNNDSTYNPMDGDYPAIKGDQMLWWVYNDMKFNTRGHNSPPLGLEIIASVYGFSCPNINADSSVLNTTFLMNLKITNKSNNNYNSMALGIWQDATLGQRNDNYVGCHIPLNTVYTYNGDNDDEGNSGYGLNIPAFGTTILKGPRAPVTDEIDNNRNGQIDEAGEDIGLMGHQYYLLSAGSDGLPTNGTNAYNYITGKWKDSSATVYGGTGYTGSTGATNFNTSLLYPGNSDLAVGWGLGGSASVPITPPFAWSEANPGPGLPPNTPGIRSNIAVMNGFGMPAGETEEITIAYIISRSTQNGPAASVSQLFADIPKVKHWFQTGNFPTCLDLSNVSVDELETGNQLQVYPNPANDQLFVRDEAGSDAQLVLMNMQGSQIRTGQLVAGEAVLNLQDVAAGVYFLQATSANKKQVYKVVVSR